MPLVLIDDSTEYFRSREAGLPAVREGKFVLLANGVDDYLVMRLPDQSRFHAGIVDWFCRSGGRDIPGHYVRDRFLIDAPGWEIAGGGYWYRNERERVFALSGRSMIYGKFGSAGLRERLAALPELEGYSISVE